MDLSKVTRLELIDAKGRQYTNYDFIKVDLSLQDQNRTLKIFVKTRNEECKHRNKCLNYKKDRCSEIFRYNLSERCLKKKMFKKEDFPQMKEVLKRAYEFSKEDIIISNKKIKAGSIDEEED